MQGRVVRADVLAGAVVAAVLTAAVAFNSLRWVGTTFPGFFVMANRVVPSIALPDWPDPSGLFQHQVLAVDGAPVLTSEDVYSSVRERPPDTLIRYTLRRPDGTLTSVALSSRVFTRANYVFLFGAYLLTGVAFAAAGLIAFRFKPQSPASVALLILGSAAGAFAITGVDLYGPHWFFRLHVAGETLVAPALIHLALVFPTDRIWRRRRALLWFLYLPFLGLLGYYEAVLHRPASYSFIHLMVSGAQGVGGVMLVAAVTYDLLTTRSVLVRRRLGVVALGTLSGFLVPIAVMTGSALLGGRVSVNVAGLTAFFFPATLGYAIVKQDLFEIDVMLRRAMTYGTVVAAIAAIYFLALYALGVMVPGQLTSWSPIALALLNFALLFLISPVRERVQEAIDRVFFRQEYRVEEALSALSLALASAHAVEDVVTHALRVFATTIAPSPAMLCLRSGDASFRRADAPAMQEIVLDAELMGRLEQGNVVARYEWDDGSGKALPAIWAALRAELLVPISAGGTLIAALVLGAKNSGRPYTLHDITFLRTAANQIALALTNASAFGQLEELNVNLERKVRERTEALHSANADLNRSLGELQQAYKKLEHSQASLLRADRLATLGRLTAGIAHEMNTPLSAVLNALKVLKDLGGEYATSIAEPDVLPDDHREIAAEIIETAEAATGWAQKAASYISSVKAHGREARPVISDRVLVSTVVAETRALLAYRLRVTSCRIDLHEEPGGICLVGDPARLNQVLLNLCTNAIDAYEDSGASGGLIEVSFLRRGNEVTMQVRDSAGGIAPEILPHIFDELFTTKGPGRGTGLGLWIARNLIEQGFGGTLAVESRIGVGSVFTATFPLQPADVDVVERTATAPDQFSSPAESDTGGGPRQPTTGRA